MNERFKGGPRYSHGMKFIFQHSPSCSPHTSFISVVVLDISQ